MNLPHAPTTKSHVGTLVWYYYHLFEAFIKELVAVSQLSVVDVKFHRIVIIIEITTILSSSNYFHSLQKAVKPTCISTSESDT